MIFRGDLEVGEECAAKEGNVAGENSNIYATLPFQDIGTLTTAPISKLVAAVLCQALFNTFSSFLLPPSSSLMEF